MTAVADIPPVWIERPAWKRKSIQLATNTRPEQPIQIDTSTPEVRTWVNAIGTRASEILQLRHGWNGPGSCPVNWKSLEKLLIFLYHIGAYDAPGAQLVPLSSGGAQVEWHFLNQRIEIGVNPDGEFFAFATDESGEYIVELEDTWFFLRSDQVSLRRAIVRYAESVRVNIHAQGTEVGDRTGRRATG